jgi:UrcA family protein
MRARFAFGAVLVATLGSATAVFAEPVPAWGRDEKLVVTLKHPDADALSAQGAGALAFRIRIAAARVCGGDDPIVRTSDQFRRCQDAVIDRAVAALDAPMVAQALGRQAGFTSAAQP